MNHRMYFSMMALFLACILSLIAPAWAAEEASDNSFSSGPKPYTVQPPTELIGAWSGRWDNSSSTIAELTIEKVTPEVSGKYKHSATRETPSGEYNFTAPLQEKSGKCCFTVVSPNTGRSMRFTLNNGKLRGEMSTNSVDMKKD